MSDNAPQPPARKRAKGRTLGWDAAEIARQARQQAATRKDASDAAWRRYTQGKNKGLLNAPNEAEPSQRG